MSEHTKKFITEVLLLIAVLAIAFILRFELSPTPSEADVATEQHSNYCEMVRLHKADPTIGWPDYKQIYDKECNE